VNPLIVIVEDFEPYAKELVEVLVDQFPELNPPGAIQLITTEAEFHQSLEIFAAAAPKLFIVDIMLRYQDPGSSDEAVPPEIRERATRDRFYRAGIRCAKRLRDDVRFSSSSIILHTILDEADLKSDADYPMPSNCIYVPKEGESQRITTEVGRILRS